MVNNEQISVGGNDDGQLIPYSSVGDTAIGQQLKSISRDVYTSLDVATPQGRATMYRARMAPALALKDCVNKDIDVSDVVIHKAQYTNRDTGEIIDALRIVLIISSGECVASMSQGVAKSLAIYCECFGSPPWPKGVRFKVVNNGKGDRVWYELIAAPPDIAAMKPGKK